MNRNRNHYEVFEFLFQMCFILNKYLRNNAFYFIYLLQITIVEEKKGKANKFSIFLSTEYYSDCIDCYRYFMTLYINLQILNLNFNLYINLDLILKISTKLFNCFRMQLNSLQNFILI